MFKNVARKYIWPNYLNSSIYFYEFPLILASILSQLLHKKMASEDQFLEGLKYILEFVEDLLVDIPKFWDFFAQILRDVLLEAAVNMSILKVSSEMLSDGLANTTAAGM